MTRRDWPIVGRFAEIDRFSTMLDENVGGLLLLGDAGVGKTRLALECLRVAERKGVATLRAMATRAATDLPYGALAPLLPDLKQRHRPVLPSEFLRLSAEAIVAQGAGGRVVLLVDDAHLLDASSATLVHHLVTTRAVFVLLTVRRGETPREQIISLWKDDLVERIEVRPLDTDAVQAVLVSVLGGSIDPAAIAYFAAHSLGNPLFLRELVFSAIDDGALDETDGLWRLGGPITPSARLAEIVDARLGSLDHAERSLLEVVCLGEPLGPAELATLADPHVADALERKGLLTSARNGRRLEVRLAHPIYGDVLTAQITPLRSRAVAASLADAVEATGARRREDRLRIAVWRLESGATQPDLMLSGAKVARARFDLPLAERLARAAIEGGCGFEAEFLLAQLAGLQGRSEDADEQLRALTAQAGSDSERGLVTVARLDNHFFYLGRFEEGLRIAQEAERGIDTQSWRDEIIARRAAIMLHREGPRACADIALPLLERNTSDVVPTAAMAASFSLARLGRLAEAEEAAVRGRVSHLERANSWGWEWDPNIFIQLRCDALAYAGRFAESEEIAAKYHRQAVQDNNYDTQAYVAWHLGRTVGERGQVFDAIQYSREAAALFHSLGRPQLQQLCLPYLALALALGGRVDEAGEVMADFDSLERKIPEISLLGADTTAPRAWICAAAGDFDAAHALLLSSADVGEELGDHVGASASLHALARLGRAKDAVDRLRSLSTVIEGDLSVARADHAEALVEMDPEKLDQAGVAFEAMGATLLAAEAASDTAVAWAHHREHRRSLRSQQRAQVLASRCSGASTPALQATPARAVLTPTERHVAIQAASGLSSREIAEKQQVSVRTVDNHLQHVYQKLGLSGRADLPAALAQPGLADPTD